MKPVVTWMCFFVFSTTGSLAVADSADSSKPEILDLFGHQEQVQKEPAKAIAESEQEIKRPQADAGRTAAFSNEQKPIQHPSKELAGWRLYDLIPLGMVLGVIAIVGFVVKKFMPARSLMGGAGLEILTRLSVSTKQSVAVVKVGKKLLVVGICPERMNTLCVIDDSAEVAEFLGELASRQPHSITQAFKASFDREVDQYPESAEHDPAAAAGGHVRGLLEKVRQLKKSREVA